MDKTLVKALRILEHLAEADRPQGVTDVASALGLSKSSVHRPLTTLMRLGYVNQDAESGRYAASLKLWEVGSSVLERLDLKRVAAGPMAELSASTGETVHLSVLDGGDVVHIDKIECQHPIRAYSRVGGRVPAHCIATGKAMLAFQPEALIEAVAANLQPATPDTIVDRSDLLAELSQIRRTGISISRGAWQPGVDGIAAPIRDAEGRVVAGVGISGPAIRLRSRERARYAPLVAEAAAKVSRALGFNPPARRSRTAATRRMPSPTLTNGSGVSLPDGASHHR
ncbi:MAG: helix-turn-helix domain-containing protein [Rhizobiales bacterium]|nr:helix-turn-helix domain-containing protein [Hyphomicrobiales bacterium]